MELALGLLALGKFCRRAGDHSTDVRFARPTIQIYDAHVIDLYRSNRVGITQAHDLRVRSPPMRVVHHDKIGGRRDHLHNAID